MFGFSRKKKTFVCGRCGYKAGSRIECPSCKIRLEPECIKCYHAKGNCVCNYHKIRKS